MSVKTSFASLLFILFLTISQSLMADGCFVTDNYGTDVYAPDQKVVISWDGKTQTMILSTKLQSEELANFGWIIPIKSKTKPEVELGDAQIFYELSDYFKLEDMIMVMGVGPAFDSIQVIEKKELDIYDITVLKASDAGQLYDWLKLNEFQVLGKTKEVLSYYTNPEFYFLAVKIDLLNQYQEDIQQLKKHGLMKHINEFTDLAPRPRRRKPRFVKIHVGGEKDGLPIDAQLFFDDRYERIGYARINQIVPISKDLYQEVRESIDNLADTISNLKSGIAKPLKISFTPSHPFFPLKISSVNGGEVGVTAYVVSKMPIEDKNGMLIPELCRDLTTDMRDSLQKHLKLDPEKQYITKLIFNGKSSAFSKDAYFVEMGEEQKRNKSWDVFIKNNSIKHRSQYKNEILTR